MGFILGVVGRNAFGRIGCLSMGKTMSHGPRSYGLMMVH